MDDHHFDKSAYVPGSDADIMSQHLFTGA